jgi:8-oxo-dGTP diphosphatase
VTAEKQRVDGVVQRTRLAAYAWCEDGNAVLLVRIAVGEVHAGCWTVPGGGLAFGEDPEAGVVRELREETGIAGRVEGLAGVRSRVREPSETISGHRVHAVGILFRVTPVGGVLRDETGGSTDRAAWVPLTDLDALWIDDRAAWARRVVGR